MMSLKKTMALFMLVVLCLAASSAWALTLYVPDAQFNFLMQTQADGEARQAQELLDALISLDALPPNIEVLSFSYLNGQGALDLSRPFGDAMAATGTAGEYLMMGGLVNTFLDAYALDGLSVTCQGRVIETGHSIYDQPLTRYPVGNTACLRLESNATTGYTWTADILDEGEQVARVAAAEYIAEEAAGAVGVGGTQVFLIEGIQPGMALILLTYARPWEEGVAPDQQRLYCAQVSADGQVTLSLLETGDEGEAVPLALG